MFDVFLSYAHVDREQVRPLVASLKERGLTVWFDEHDVDVFGGITSAVADGIIPAKDREEVGAKDLTRRVCYLLPYYALEKGDTWTSFSSRLL